MNFMGFEGGGMNYALENYNIASDKRSCNADEQPVLLFSGCGVCGVPGEACDCPDYKLVEIEQELPTKYGVCPVCEGEGKHVNAAIDAGGLTAEDFHDDPDFAEAYMGGVYDVTCNRCEGRRVVFVVDWDALSDDERKAYKQQLRDEADSEAERLAEIRMGC